jgi:tRNA nucleotidyltransferase (CCA-adding enzyme)
MPTQAWEERPKVLMLGIPDDLATILRETPELTKAYLVGGCVRDALLGLPQKDFDIEAFGVSYENLAVALARWGRTDLVGKSFGVVKLTTRSGALYDFTVPRRDSKVAPGHRGFEISCDPGIEPRDAAARRDFTINALMFDPRADQVLDFFNGVEDLRTKTLRHTTEAFTEDPLRVLRGMQFAGRFGLKAAPETITLSRKIRGSHGELAVERVREEWFKWATKSTIPSAGLQFLRQTGWIEHYPELHAIVGIPQDAEWHPEGDVFIHTCHCCDALVSLPAWQRAADESKIVFAFAVLTHDFGKASTTQQVERDGIRRIISPGHEETGVTFAESFLRRIDSPNAIVERVLPLVRNHMAHLHEVTDRSVRRLARRLVPETIEGLCVLMTADAFGRPPRPPCLPAIVTALQQRAVELQVENRPPEPILKGRHLMELGMSPGKTFGRILDAAYEAQLEGKFFDVDQAYGWLATQGQLELPEAARIALRRLNRQT